LAPSRILGYVTMKSLTENTTHQGIRDILGLIGFIVAVIVGAWLINLIVFRSFSVSGPSMESTLYTGDRLIVNRIPLTWASMTRSTYLPERGHVIVFRNPRFDIENRDEYIVKRVIGLPGEHVSVKNGSVTVTNKDFPAGFDPYDSITSITRTPVSGLSETDVPADEIFVIGDHRDGEFSMDSRNGLGTIPLNDIVGPVVLRLYPFDKIAVF
jgi:signal peptidase I